LIKGNPGPAVLFDIDGTLVDSNYLHVHAWYRTFQDVGLYVEAWRIHRAIGMDGSTLLKSLSGSADDDTRSRLKDLHSRYYKETTPLLRRLPGARELLAAVDKLGLQIVLATSAPEDELAILREVLASGDLVSAETSSNDVDTAKPQPDIVHVALDRAGVDAFQRGLRRRHGVGRGGMSASRGADDRRAQRWRIPRRTRNSRCASGFRERERVVRAPGRHCGRYSREVDPERLISWVVSRTPAAA
jgi:phosphoglycolate phosphatase-like HAD superfamily hydrolase